MDFGIVGSNMKVEAKGVVPSTSNNVGREESKHHPFEEKQSVPERARGVQGRPGGKKREPKKMVRATTWTPEVENAFRLQCAGWRSVEEYLQQYDEDLSVWPSNQFIKALKAKQNGFFMYFRNYRECEDKYLNRVKLFSY
eukprot:CAMPEP_0182603066 /NCGR_PEP_ID=MMETSP1324-20130603/92306_1 /TAXON_ID=236786 /ORGANISM="Florenciella sp., Strain RCC1587" /LENGTH=139 /DNA_ID=CAMNT_0024820993 /DNA_START=459 /DNA_END=878 /DNA_ORIENTATION=-